MNMDIHGGGLIAASQHDSNSQSIPLETRATHDENFVNDTKKPSKIARLWAKTGLDVPTIFTMVKAALPPTIAIAFYQSVAVSNVYSTLGYLVAIASILGFAIMPRAKFLQTMIFDILAICIGAAVNLLAIWTVIQARKHTTPAGASPTGYNSSASAVSAIWLFFQVYLVSSLKSARPQLRFPGILYNIFCIVAMIYSPEFPTMAAGISFAEKLLEAFLTGFAIATGVSLLFIPVTCRTVIFKEFTGFLQGLRNEIRAQIDYTQSLEHVDMFFGSKSPETLSKATKGTANDNKDEGPLSTPEAKALRATVSATRNLFGKLATDMTFAKREVAYGKLGPDQLSEIFVLLRNIYMPLQGMSSLMDIFQTISKTREWQHEVYVNNREQDIVLEWQNVMKTLHAPFAEIGTAIYQGLEHALLRLELHKKPKKKALGDPEAMDGRVGPGDENFADFLEERIRAFHKNREMSLKVWCEAKGIALPSESFGADYEWINTAPLEDGSKDHRQLFVILYMEYLLASTAKATLDLIGFAESWRADETVSRVRLIWPGQRRLSKWAKTLLHQDNHVHDNVAEVGVLEAESRVNLGQAYQTRKDPEHLPPRNRREKLGNTFRAISAAFRSPHSAFGFRVSCATMTVAIVAYLHDTQDFFIEQRLLWSLIMISISMTRTSGQSFFNFICRVFGTFVAMLASFVIYYIVDGRTAGIIVFLFFWIASCFYIVVKLPRFTIVGIISAVTVVLIIGYELQVRQIGVAAATSNFQPYYPIYELAPYRLACVAGGLAVAFIWTIFPYPISDHSELRRDLGATLYLLASFYAVVHETVGSKVRGDEGDMHLKGSPGHRMEKLRHKTFAKIMLLIGRLQESAEFTKWEISLGGRFPIKTYNTLIDCSQKVLQYSALISYASRSFEHTEETESRWQADFRVLMKSTASTSHDITSRLCLLSNSVTNGTPLPPYLQPLEPYSLTKKLDAVDKDILSIRHVAEPGYAAFAVMQIAARSITGDLDMLTDEVRNLVGELDFSFQVVPQSLSGSSHDSATSGDDMKGKRE